MFVDVSEMIRTEDPPFDEVLCPLQQSISTPKTVMRSS